MKGEYAMQDTMTTKVVQQDFFTVYLMLLIEPFSYGTLLATNFVNLVTEFCNKDRKGLNEFSKSNWRVVLGNIPIFYWQDIEVKERTTPIQVFDKFDETHRHAIFKFTPTSCTGQFVRDYLHNSTNQSTICIGRYYEQLLKEYKVTTNVHLVSHCAETALLALFYASENQSMFSWGKYRWWDQPMNADQAFWKCFSTNADIFPSEVTDLTQRTNIFMLSC